MSKKVFLLVLILLVAFIPVLAGAYTDPVSAGCVRIHYLRTDFSYDGWGLHVWGDGYAGAAIDWISPLKATGMDEYGPYWDVSYGAGLLNFIIHNGDAKQYDADRVFPEPVEGKEVWVIQDDSGYYMSVSAALNAAAITAVPEIPADITRLYYLRVDKTYDGWGLHAWTNSGDLPGVSWGAPLPITGYDKYGYAYWDIPSNINGYIIHNGDIKDTQDNRSLDTSSNENYVVSGDAANYIDRLTAFNRAGNRIIDAKLIALNVIQLNTAMTIDIETIRVLSDVTGITIIDIDASQAPVYIITLAQDLDITKTYQIAINNMSTEVTVAPELLDTYYAYNGKLGAIYSPTATIFKLWAPTAADVKLLFFSSNGSSSPSSTISMTKSEKGVWSCIVYGNQDGQLYQYQVAHGRTTRRVLDPYAVSMAAFDSNGPDPVGKGVVIDLNKTDPPRWRTDNYIKLDNQEDAIIYEVHVRDFTIADTSISQVKRGTYEGFIERIPYLKQLGITHVQLQPVQNWYYGNEFNKTYESGMATDNCNYNWGYDPHNYNTPEGWFSSNPDNPYARVRELKQLISKLHDAGIGVVLDVVYNHTAVTGIFEDIVPNYYYRRNTDGSFTNGSGCGNDTASERAMFRKFMIDSATYWVREYHVDGFRFDLMGLHDIDTMEKLAYACRAINPYIELHGEGWDMGTLPLQDRYCKGGGSEDDYHRALLEVSHGISAFSDGMRDGLIQQSYQSPTIGGFVQNDTSYQRDNEAYVRRGIVGNIIDYTTSLPINTNNYDCFCDDPEEAVNYITCYDGLTINDKLTLTLPSISRSEFIKRYKLQCAMILTSQSKAFFQAGEEIFRSKPATDASANQNYIFYGYCHNSHDASDDINKIDWSRYLAREPETMNLHDFYMGMISLRKKHQAFRMDTTKKIQDNLTFIDEAIDGLIAYRVRYADGDGEERWNNIIVIFNATSVIQTVNIPGVNLTGWKVVVNGDQVNINGVNPTGIVLNNGSISVPGISAVVIHAPVREKSNQHYYNGNSNNDQYKLDRNLTNSLLR